MSYTYEDWLADSGLLEDDRLSQEAVDALKWLAKEATSLAMERARIRLREDY